MTDEELKDYQETMRDLYINTERKEYLESNRMNDALYGIGYAETAFDVFAIEFIKKFGMVEFKRVCMR